LPTAIYLPKFAVPAVVPAGLSISGLQEATKSTAVTKRLFNIYFFIVSKLFLMVMKLS